jgi:uncharacterized membrane protein
MSNKIYIALGVALAIYLFISMISNTDFKGMSFSEVKLVVSVILGVSVSVISVSRGIKIMESALGGFVVGAILYALIAMIF